ncbi:MAG: histidinol-phosphatase [Phycisphaeraceae bacterium]|nr:histidinol-phosphatase [Phycisphaeraceae bacterium]
MTQPILYEQHMHTPLCKHAKGMPTEYAARAEKVGLKGIVVTCHNPLPDGISSGVRMSEDQWQEYQDLVAQTREEWAGKVDVRLGIEADWLPGIESYVEKQLASAPLNHVLGSVHPQIPEYREIFWKDDAVQYHKDYFSNLVKVAQTGLYDTLSHPDLVKNCYAARWDLDAMMDHICHCLDDIAKTGMAMELNTSGILKVIEEFNPAPAILKQMRVRNIPCVIGADAHCPERVGDGYIAALDLLDACGYENVSFFLDRKRHQVPITDARESLRSAANAV